MNTLLMKSIVSFVAHRATDIALTVQMESIATGTVLTSVFGAGQLQLGIAHTARKRSTKSRSDSQI